MIKLRVLRGGRARLDIHIEEVAKREDRDNNQSDIAACQGMLETIRSGKKQKANFALVSKRREALLAP